MRKSKQLNGQKMPNVIDKIMVGGGLMLLGGLLIVTAAHLLLQAASDSSPRSAVVALWALITGAWGTVNGLNILTNRKS